MPSRLDKLLVDQGHVPSRQRAQALIKAGAVYVDGRPVVKPAATVSPQAVIELRGSDLRYVSRGGYKLEKAIAVFDLQLAGLTCLDIGASTGGFTDCMLQNGARRVYAVDVGHDQLDAALCADPRVVDMPGVNIRDLTPQLLPQAVDFFSVDVSFISLEYVFSAAAAVSAPSAGGVCLVKPQFEAGRAQVGKNGVVREAKVHQAVLQKVVDAARAQGFFVRGLDFSPIRGQHGNIEFLLYISKISPDSLSSDTIARTVAAAHAALRQEK